MNAKEIETQIFTKASEELEEDVQKELETEDPSQEEAQDILGRNCSNSGQDNDQAGQKV